MANHSFLQEMTEPLSPDMLEELLRAANEKYFGGKLCIERWGDATILSAWTLTLDDEDGFQVWLNDDRNIEAPHRLAWASVFHWAQDLILVTIRESHGGKVTDDGVDEPLFMDCGPSAIDTFKKWWMRCHEFFSDDKDSLERLYDRAVANGPSTLSDFIGMRVAS